MGGAAPVEYNDTARYAGARISPVHSSVTAPSSQRQRPELSHKLLHHPNIQATGISVCVQRSTMKYYILASFCLLGMASSQTITNLTACVTKEQNLIMECKFTSGSSGSPNCVYLTEGKVLASTSASFVPDPTFKGRGSVSIANQVCKLTLTGFPSDQPKTYTCNIMQSSNATKAASVDKKSTVPCSACKFSAVSLLLALLIFPVLLELL